MNEAREAEGWAEAEAYVEGIHASNRDEVMDDFMTGWRTADRTRKVTDDMIFSARAVMEDHLQQWLSEATVRAALEAALGEN